jgi:Gram-negative bacterial TonB protein C-terminal
MQSHKVAHRCGLVPVLNSIGMRSGKILKFLFFIIVLCADLMAQDRGIEFLSGPQFVLSETAVAAGIDGTLTVSFEVDRTGSIKDVTVLAGPIWPCNETPEKQLKEVREAVKKNILASKFSPATKNGKPIDADATLDFAIGEAYKEALKGQTTSKSKWVVDVRDLQARATRLPRPTFTGVIGSTTVRVLIGETGKVIAAGAIRGHAALHATSRRAACDATFPPTFAGGRPIKVTGLIHYDFARGFVRSR